MTKKNTNVLCYRSVPDSEKSLRAPVKNNGKWTGSYSTVKSTDIFYSVIKPNLNITSDLCQTSNFIGYI